MGNFDRAGVEKILLQLEDKVFFDSESPYKFYRVENSLCLLGAGGTSYVYEMYDEQAPDRHYALKVIGFSGSLDDINGVSYSVSAQYQLSEQSENIVRVISLRTMKLIFDDEDNVTGLVRDNEESFDASEGLPIQMILMEKLESIISKDKYGNVYLTRNELRTEEEIINFTKQIGRAIFTVHSYSVLHRDIKLENIFWDPVSGRYKLGDFGVARYVDDGSAETVLFTDGYGAPEIEKRLRDSYNATADIYSFGITLYLLLNDLKFPGSDSYRANLIQYEKDFIPPAPQNSSERMARIVRTMCNYRPEDRYQSIEEVLMEIGRLDGTYTEKGFEEEYEDIPTELYREEDDLETATYREDQEDPMVEEETKSWLDKDESEFTREERKKLAKAIAEMYVSSSRWRFFLTAIATFCIYKALSPNAEYVKNWLFWILPISLVVESVLQRIREFHIEFCIVTICLAMFSIINLRPDVPHILMILIVLIGSPTLTAGCAAGTGLWILQSITGKWAWLSFLSDWDLGWIAIIGLATVIFSNIFMSEVYDRVPKLGEIILLRIMETVCFLIVVTGIILLILSGLKIIVIPEIITHLHLVRTGIGIYAVLLFYLWHYGLLDDDTEEETDINESLDE